MIRPIEFDEDMFKRFRLHVPNHDADEFRAAELLTNHNRRINMQRRAMDAKDVKAIVEIGEMFEEPHYHMNNQNADPFTVPITVERRTGKVTVGEAEVEFKNGILHIIKAMLNSDGLVDLGIKMTLTSFSVGPFQQQTPEPFITAVNEANEIFTYDETNMEVEH